MTIARPIIAMLVFAQAAPAIQAAGLAEVVSIHARDDGLRRKATEGVNPPVIHSHVMWIDRGITWPLILWRTRQDSNL